MFRPRLCAGILLSASALLWRGSLAGRWTDRVPEGWHYRSDYVGVQTNADTVTGKLPERDEVADYVREMRDVSPPVSSPTEAVLEDSYVVHDARSGEVTFRYTTHERVDRRTGARLEPQFRGDFAVFPRNVEKRTYRLRANYVKGVPLAFDREDDIDGMRTYLFTYVGAGEYTQSFTSADAHPAFHLPPGQEVRCADDQFYYRVWVEPLTGAILKVEEGCPSGDYVVETATGKRLTAVDRFSGVTAGNALLVRVAEARRSRVVYLAAAVYVPLVLVTLAIVGFFGATRERSTPRFA